VIYILGQSRRLYMPAKRKSSLRMRRHVRAVLRGIGVRKWLIPTLKDFRDHTSKDRPARSHTRIMMDELGEPLDYLTSGHVQHRAGLSVRARTDFNRSLRSCLGVLHSESKPPLPACLTRTIPPDVEVCKGGSERDRCEKAVDSSLKRFPGPHIQR
jgi:hypothetical protein